jgi:hypothetical protein
MRILSGVFIRAHERAKGLFFYKILYQKSLVEVCDNLWRVRMNKRVVKIRARLDFVQRSDQMIS